MKIQIWVGDIPINQVESWRRRFVIKCNYKHVQPVLHPLHQIKFVSNLLVDTHSRKLPNQFPTTIYKKFHLRTSTKFCCCLRKVKVVHFCTRVVDSFVWNLSSSRSFTNYQLKLFSAIIKNKCSTIPAKSFDVLLLICVSSYLMVQQ